MGRLMVLGAERADVVLVDDGLRVTFHRPVPATPGDEVELVVADGAAETSRWRTMGRWLVKAATLCGGDVTLELERAAPPERTRG